MKILAISDEVVDFIYSPAVKERFGDGSIMKFGESHAMDIDAVSTGSTSIDIALGVKGIPRGRITEIFGPEASGKTTLAISFVKKYPILE